MKKTLLILLLMCVLGGCAQITCETDKQWGFVCQRVPKPAPEAIQEESQ